VQCCSWLCNQKIPPGGSGTVTASPAVGRAAVLRRMGIVEVREMWLGNGAKGYFRNVYSGTQMAGSPT
jgi:hypothetical protein